MTAAHCLLGPDDIAMQVELIPHFFFIKSLNYFIKIRLGEHHLMKSGETRIPEKNISVVKAIRHEDYQESTSHNDIAILELSEEVDLKVYTPICLPKDKETFIGQKAWIYGKKF